MSTGTSIRKTEAGSLFAGGRSLLVGDLERALLAAFPASDACDWDRTGMLVGSPAQSVRGVAIALDPTLDALQGAQAAGANVLITHHPVFLDAPECFTPASVQGHRPGAVVRRACELDINIMSFHTALDVSEEGLGALPSLLRLNPAGVLDPLEGAPEKGLGCLCIPQAEESPLSLRHLAARCVSVFGSMPRVWGHSDVVLDRICACGGSASGMTHLCLEAKVDCLVCGEIKYHEALDAYLSGLAIIELGHDVSEFPLCALLAAHTAGAGVPENCITMIDQKNKWQTPESSRR